ncbi:MAG: Gfo/Idh/MocA family protein [Gammaproteobacteria bacterium]
MKRLKAAVIGAGYLGRFHAEKYAALPEVELVAVVDVIEGRAEALASAHGAHATTDFRTLFGKVDLASVVVPTEAHFPIACALLGSGVHVLVEKPMAASLWEADRMIDLARAARLVLQIGHLERFNPALLALGGVLKQPLFIESHRIAAFGPRGLEVSVVLDLMIHDIDIILNIVKSPVTAIRPTGLPVLSGEVDIAHARLEFASGCVANVTASRVSREPLRKVRVFQRDGYVSIDYLSRKVAVCRREGGPEAFRITTEELCFEKQDALLMEIQAFVQAVREGTPAAVSGEDGRAALAVALAISEAIRANRGE